MSEKTKGLSIHAYNNKMDLLEVKLDQIERTLSNKADEVVSVQVLEHRLELEELVRAVSKIEAHLEKIDEELSMLVEPKPSSIVNQKRTKRHVSGKITPLFS